MSYGITQLIYKLRVGGRRTIYKSSPIFIRLLKNFPLVLSCIRLIKRFVGRAVARMASSSLLGSGVAVSDPAALEALFISGDVDRVESTFLAVACDVVVVSGIVVPPLANASLAAAVFVEGMAGRSVGIQQFLVALGVAEQLLRRAISIIPYWPELQRALGTNLWFQGRFAESIHAFDSGERARDAMAQMAGWPIDSRVYLPRNCTEVIGLMGHMDGFIKYKVLSGDQRPYYLLAGPQQIVNSAYLEYWKEHIKIITDPDEILEHTPYERVYAVNWNWAMPKNGELALVHEGLAVAQRGWQIEKRAPLLQLRQEHLDHLIRARIKWGMDIDAKYICLHVRSAGFYGLSNEGAQRFRNTSIELYYPLIKSLVAMGFWVFRMGDPSMQPLDMSQFGDSERVVDYALSKDKSAELDVALCARCDLFISTNSGLHALAYSSGRKVCCINYPINSGMAWHHSDIFITQLYYSHSKKRVLTFEEVLGSDIVFYNHHFLFERAGISLIPNEPDDIIQTVRESLSPSTYQVQNSELANQVRDHFNEISNQYGREITGRLGLYFAAKYAAQLAPNCVQTPNEAVLS